MAILAMRQEPIGLDIGVEHRRCQLGGKSPMLSLAAVHERRLPEGIVFEGEVLDPDGLAAELKSFVKEGRFKGKLVRLGVGNQKVIVRTIEVPEMDEEELRGAIEFQAQDYIPMPIEEVVLDFQVVRRQVDSEGVVRQQVVLVAAQKEMVHLHLHAARKAGLSVDGIDVSAFALIRALSSPVSFVDQGAPAEEATGFLHLTSSTSTLVVASDGIPLFTRIVSFAYDNFVNVLVEGQGVAPEEGLALTEFGGCARTGSDTGRGLQSLYRAGGADLAGQSCCAVHRGDAALAGLLPKPGILSAGHAAHIERPRPPAAQPGHLPGRESGHSSGTGESASEDRGES